MTLSPQDSTVSSYIPAGSPPSYSDSLPPRPLASTLLSPSAPPSPPLPSLLLRAPCSSRYHHCTSGSTPIYHTHLFDLSRPVPEALLLPKLGSAPENNGKRVNGLFWSERGQVKVVVGVVGRETGERRSPVRLVFGSRPERRGEGKVDVEILHRHPPTLPLSISLTSTFGSLRLLLPRNFRGHLTHHHHHHPASSSSSPSHLILSPQVQAIYTLLSNTQGFIGRFDEGESDEYDASSDGLDEAFLSTKGGTITVGFADEHEYEYEYEHASSEMDTHQLNKPFVSSPPSRPISSALDPLLLPTTTASSSSSPPFRLSPFWTQILSSSIGPFLLGLLLLGLVATVYLFQHGPAATIQRVQQWEWNELGRMIIWTGCGMEVVAVGWLGWEVVRRLGWGR